ncbi:hypothetical protein JTE90_011547 [Oedothorax gibbosus]|uniref:Uncharacterized protein n=1 Tax=Oedothorax gibbosus TaxID=931172 RepID=A0AAV6UI00_9ARAC|nr:hypothetical protein JTE90_011547 [Oedothorax gibbosus]
MYLNTTYSSPHPMKAKPFHSESRPKQALHVDNDKNIVEISHPNKKTATSSSQTICLAFQLTLILSVF